MKILSFNLRYDNPDDGVNRFANRRERVIDKLLCEAPDVAGFQEVLPDMLAYLRARLEGYALVGCGRGADYLDEHNPVMYRLDRYELIALDVTWLSPTPLVPGSRYKHQSPCPRIVTHTILRDMRSGALFHFYNTHLDHESSRARVLGAGRLIAKLASDARALSAPALITGDLNAYPDSPEIALLSNEFDDLTTGVGTTWHGFSKYSPPRIDYIFARGFERAGEACLWTDKYDDMFLSDHYAVEVNVRRT